MKILRLDVVKIFENKKFFKGMEKKPISAVDFLNGNKISISEFC